MKTKNINIDFFKFLTNSVPDINLCQIQSIFQAHKQLLLLSFLYYIQFHSYWIKFGYSIL